MKKSFKLLIILLLALLAFVAVGSKALTDSAEMVTVEERASFGDKAEAKGLRINIPVRSNMGYRGLGRSYLRWDTDFVLDGAVKTQVTLSIQNNGVSDFASYLDSGIYISTDVDADTYTLDAEEEMPNGLDAVYQEIASDTKVKSPWQRLVCFNDYYDKYPLLVELYIDGQRYVSEFGYWAGAEGADDGIVSIGKSIDMNLQPEYLYTAQVSARKDAKGKILAYHCTTYRASAGVFSASDVTDTDIYYGADVRSLDGGRPKEIIGDGYGIWRIGYALAESKVEEQVTKAIWFTESEPKLIWPMEKDDILLDIVISEDQQELLLFTGVDGMCVLTVIDVETLQELQRLELMEYEVSSEYMPEISHVFRTENAVVPLLTEGKLAVVSKAETGEYTLEFVLDKDLDRQEEAITYIEEKHGEKTTLWNRKPATIEMDWHDGKLAMVYALTNDHGSGRGGYLNEQPCAFWVAVYDQSGMIYGGEYYLSQGVGEYCDHGNKISEIQVDVRMGIHWSEGGEEAE
ncbi:MAG: hypothetical protein IJZ85_12800 [Lachnospiraceae bacterium]|nr:hypothetical protein [Lachnospiraceae bacterium]